MLKDNKWDAFTEVNYSGRQKKLDMRIFAEKSRLKCQFLKDEYVARKYFQFSTICSKKVYLGQEL